MMKEASLDDCIDKAKFINYYKEMAKSQKATFKHLKRLGYRKDFKKLNQVHDKRMFKRTKMPRYTIA